jgi:hypothetical protein
VQQQPTPRPFIEEVAGKARVANSGHRSVGEDELNPQTADLGQKSNGPFSAKRQTTAQQHSYST